MPDMNTSYNMSELNHLKIRNLIHCNTELINLTRNPYETTA